MTILYSHERIGRLFHSLAAGSDYHRHHKHHKTLNCNIYSTFNHAAKVHKIIETAKYFLKKMQRKKNNSGKDKIFPNWCQGCH
jgi:hypothetical protein